MKYIFFLSVFYLLLSINVMCQTTVVKYYECDENNDTIEHLETLKISKDLYHFQNHDIKFSFNKYIYRNEDKTIFLSNDTKYYSLGKKSDNLKGKYKVNNKIKFLKGSKEILGYTCFRARVISYNKSHTRTYDIWYTKELADKDVNNGDDCDGIQGLIMERTLSRSDRKEKFCKKVVSIKKTDEVLKVVIPEGFSELPEKVKNIKIDF